VDNFEPKLIHILIHSLSTGLSTSENRFYFNKNSRVASYPHKYPLTYYYYY